MALDAKFDIEIRQTGADTNAGGFARGSYMAPPSAPTVNANNGGSITFGNYYCVVTYSDASGETVISGETLVVSSLSFQEFIVTSPGATTGALTWSVYFGTTTGGPYWPQGTGLTIGSNQTVTTTPPTTGTQPRGIDYSQQDSPQINVADGVANGTTTFTSATAAFTGAHVGNLIRVGSATWRHITAVTNATTIVLDATVGTNTGLPVVVGGAFLTPGILGAIVPAQDTTGFLAYSASIYTMSNSNNVSGGNISLSSRFNLIGYHTTRTLFNTDALRPTIKPTANSMIMLNCSDADLVINNIAFTNPDSHTGTTCFNGGNAWVITNCKVNGYATFHGSANYCVYTFCDISTTSGSALGSFTKMAFCDIHDGGAVQFGQASTCTDCNFYNITGTTNYAAQLNGDGSLLTNCNFYNITTESSIGSAIQANKSSQVINCVIDTVNPATHSGYAFDAIAFTGSSYQQNFINNFTYNIKTAVANPANVSNDMLYGNTALTSSPFANPGSGNFAPNTTPGGGADITGTALPTEFPAGTTANAMNAGSVQGTGSSGFPTRARVFTGM